ncbi:UNVERIFIED_CONTAM: hypothetical protein GTU68_007105 [Idotea baltica]|nr:hypothetical protein [Idotea baltica]
MGRRSSSPITREARSRCTSTRRTQRLAAPSRRAICATTLMGSRPLVSPLLVYRPTTTRATKSSRPSTSCRSR